MSLWWIDSPRGMNEWMESSQRVTEIKVKSATGTQLYFATTQQEAMRLLWDLKTHLFSSSASKSIVIQQWCPDLSLCTVSHNSHGTDLWPLNKYRIQASCHSDRSTQPQTTQAAAPPVTDAVHHMTPRAYHKHHNPRLKGLSLTWHESHAEKKLSTSVTLSDDSACTGAVWSELWRSELGSRCEYQKLWLNLGPIISAPAAKGNISASPHNSHHLWGFGLWSHTRCRLLLNSDGVSRSFVPSSDKARFVCKIQVLPLGMLTSLLFMQNRLPVQFGTFHRQHNLNPELHIQPLFYMVLQTASHCWTPFVGQFSPRVFEFSFVQMLFFTQCKAHMQAIFILLPPFLSPVCHTTWAQSTTPSVPVWSDVNYSTLQRGRKNKQECWNQSACWKQLEIVSHKNNYSLFFLPWDCYHEELKREVISGKREESENSHLSHDRWLFSSQKNCEKLLIRQTPLS